MKPYQSHDNRINISEYFSENNNYKKLKRKQQRFFDIGTQSLSKYTYQIFTPKTANKPALQPRQNTETSQHLPSISGKNTATEPDDISGELDLNQHILGSPNDNILEDLKSAAHQKRKKSNLLRPDDSEQSIRNRAQSRNYVLNNRFLPKDNQLSFFAAPPIQTSALDTLLQHQMTNVAATSEIPRQKGSHRASLKMIIDEQEKKIENPNQYDKEEEQKGVDMVIFNNANQKRALVQPKFMQHVGSMCVSELWNDQMRQDLIQFQIKSRNSNQVQLKQSQKVRAVAENKDFFSVYRPGKMQEEKNIIQKVSDLNRHMTINNLNFDQLVHTFGLKSRRFKNLSPYLSRRASTLAESPLSPKKPSQHSQASSQQIDNQLNFHKPSTMTEESIKKLDLIQTRCQEMVEVTFGLEDLINKSKKEMNDYLTRLQKGKLDK